MGVYQLFGFAGGERDYGGVITRAPQTPGPFWLLYFNVPAIDAAVGARQGQKAARSPTGRWKCPAASGSSQATDPKAHCSRWSRPSAETTVLPACARAAGPKKKTIKGSSGHAGHGDRQGDDGHGGGHVAGTLS